MHPAGLRCSSLTYTRYARSSRLAGRAPRRPEWRTYFRTSPKLDPTDGFFATRLTARSAPSIIGFVLRQLRTAIIGISLVPCLAFSAALPQAHRHDAGPHHPHATVHQHFEAHHDHDGAELSPADGRVTWLDRVALQGEVWPSFAPVPLAVAFVVALDTRSRWIAVEAIDGAPPHGPPRPGLSLRGPPTLPSCVI